MFIWFMFMYDLFAPKERNQTAPIFSSPSQGPATQDRTESRNNLGVDERMK